MLLLVTDLLKDGLPSGDPERPPSLGMVTLGAAGSSSTWLKRSEYEWAVLERALPMRELVRLKSPLLLRH